MGDVVSSVENDLMDLIRQDESQKMKNIITKNNINKNILIGPHKRTLIQYSSYFGSTKCLKELINMNYNINELEYETNNTALFIACKFNFFEFVFILLNNNKEKCEILRKNNEGLNEFEVAFLRGNYEVCYFLLYLYEDKNNDKDIINTDNSKTLILEENIEEQLKIDDIKLKEKEKSKMNNFVIGNKYFQFFINSNFTLEKYIGIQEYLGYPLFNLQLFYDSLKRKINPEKNINFSYGNKKLKKLENKIPDPNESWKNFMKRMVKMELYNPPLVDKKNVTKANSLYMKTQMKIISMEYGLNMGYQ